MVALGIVADDLTGATTVAAVLARSGVSNTVLFSREGETRVPTDGAPVEALIVSTDSRPVAPAEARRRVQAATRSLRDVGIRQFSKRIDTTCRGGIGHEVEAMLGVLGDAAVAVMVPAMPESRRIVVGGYSLIDSVLVSRTGAGRDVRTPVLESHLPTLFRGQLTLPLGYVGIGAVVAGGEQLEQAFTQQRSQGCRVILADATSTADIDEIAQALVRLDWDVLCVDPGPFTERYAVRRGAVQISESPARTRRSDSAPDDRGTVLVVAGSATAVTHRQIRSLLDVAGTAAVEIDVESLVGEQEGFEAECRRVARAARDLLVASAPRVLVLGLSSSLRGEIVDLDDLERRRGLPPGEAPARLPQRLGRIARAVADELGDALTGAYLTGGDVMVEGMRALDAEGIRLVDYVIPQADQGVIVGGPYAGLPVVCKGGLTGDELTATECVNRIFDERKTNE